MKNNGFMSAHVFSALKKSLDKTRISDKILILLILTVSWFFVYSRFISGEGKGWERIISSDGTGYYAFLPSLLIYSDPRWLKFTDAEKKAYGHPDYNPKYLTETDHYQVNKYFAGEAILLLPFFLAGTFLTWLTGFEMNGLSFWFQLSAGTGALFYLFLGLFLIQKILRYEGFNEKTISWVLIGISLGTNLLYYSYGEPSMSHVFSFFSLNAFLWFCLKGFFREKDLAPWCEAETSPPGTEDQRRGIYNLNMRMLCGLALGISVLIRPTNILIILCLPLFFNENKRLRDFFQWLLDPRKSVFFLSFLATLMIQPVLWYIQSGRIMIWTYPGEGFYFLDPKISDFLFSYRRGWFVYTPLAFVSLTGIFFLTDKSLRKAFFAVLFYALLIWLTSAWWCWYYGDGFGQRPMIDFYGILALLLAFLLQGTSAKIFRYFFSALIMVCIFLNLFQTWQYENGIIARDNMNKIKYRYVFLKTSHDYRNCLGGCAEIPFYGADTEHPLAEFYNDFSGNERHWINQNTGNYRISSSGIKSACLLSKMNEYGPGIETRFSDFLRHQSKLYCEVEFMIRDSLPGSSNLAMLVFSIDSLSRSYNYYSACLLNDIPQENNTSWRNCYYSIVLPRIENIKSRLKIYVWNPGKGTFFLAEYKIRIFGRRT